MTVIPYREMRRILGLPEPTWEMRVSAIGYAFREAAEDMAVVGLAFADKLNAVTESVQATQQPPMWADNPTRQRRARKTRNHRRVK